MAKAGIPRDIVEMSFERALEELQGIVGRLEKGEGKLDEAIESYKRGAALKQHCEAKLREAQQEIAKISLESDGTAKSEPLQID